MPLALVWEDHGEDRLARLAAVTVARVRQQANVGVIADAFSDEGFDRTVVAAIAAGTELACDKGRIRFSHTAAFAALAGADFASLEVKPLPAQTSNTAIVIGQRLFLKGYRRLQAGINPELEMGRFLTEVAHFPNAVPLAGSIDYTGADGTSFTLALLQSYVENQGDAWSYTVDYLDRFLEQRMRTTDPVPADAHAAYLALIRKLGLRTAQMHLALATKSGDPAFDPEPLAPADLTAWKARARDEAQSTLDLLAQRRGELAELAQADAEALIAARPRLLEQIETAASTGLEATKIRYHGDYHLAQVLLRENDFIITDFEGEPTRSLAERRTKHSPLRDVAGMLRSFNYVRYAGLQRVGTNQPKEYAQLQPDAAAWEKDVRETFLSAYFEAASGRKLFGSPDEVQGLLRVFELEKALYELRYELGNRVDWVYIPLRGLLALLG
jgi:maltose alpha-D-glucosyltransferase/alpha-amylase